MQFTWQKNPIADNYQFQLSKSSDFTVLIKDTTGLLDTSITQTNLSPYTIYFWRVKFSNAIGSSDCSVRKFRTQQAASVAVNNALPTEYQLLQNYPNPFNPNTMISFTLKDGGTTSLKVYDVLGREVGTVVNEYLAAGAYSFQFNAENLTDGVYFYQLTSGKFSAVKKMLLVK